MKTKLIFAFAGCLALICFVFGKSRNVNNSLLENVNAFTEYSENAFSGNNYIRSENSCYIKFTMTTRAQYNLPSGMDVSVSGNGEMTIKLPDAVVCTSGGEDYCSPKECWEIIEEFCNQMKDYL